MLRHHHNFVALVLFASLGLGLALTTTASAVDWRDIAFPIKTHDFGTRAVAAKTEFRFPIVNTMSSEMHIQSVRASCGCTTPIIETEYIQPGQQGSLLARFNTGTFRGKKGATLTVIIDKPFYSEVRLEVKGYIRSDMVFHPGAIEFGTVDQGTSVTQSTQVLYAGRSDWKIQSVRSNKPWLMPSIKQTLRGEGKVNYELSVAIREDAPQGFFQDEVTVVTNDASMPTVPLPVTGSIESALTISPQSLALGTMKPGESVSKRIVVKGREPFTIETIEAEGWNVEFSGTDIPRTTHLINTTFTPTEAVGPQKIAVKIKTGGDSSVSANALLTAHVRDR